MTISDELKTQIEMAQLKKQNQQLQKKLNGQIQARRKTRKEKALDFKIQTENVIHHFYHQERKNVEYETQELTPNSEKISFGKIGSFWGSFEMYAYENNQEHIYIALNGKVLQLDKFDLRKWLSLSMKGGRYLDVLGKKRKKKPKTVNH